ncbi:DUF192 domain-containing protein [Kordia sp.]|uniref:DUF192 domain-containing protein n=1 Tax=Kordia sp. TaxID=1965332 RepID=UPI0025C44D75|nr:DUF192 domain-containing protein [Kordia sp.]MCH2195957.1 DUF192 domain-containing protein [Kordia sp.]
MKKLIVLFCITTALISCGDSSNNQTVQTAEITFTKEGQLTLAKASGKDIVTLDIEFAETSYEIETGLMYRKSMKENQAMLFVFPYSRPQSFYMKNTYIPLDIIYLDENKKIVSFQENAEPLNETGLPSEVPAMYVLEINAGLSEKWLLEIGDTATFIKF